MLLRDRLSQPWPRAKTVDPEEIARFTALAEEWWNPNGKFRPIHRTLEKIYVETGNATGALVIPVGLAFEEAYARKPDMKLHKKFDGSHPNLLGTYLAACVVFASVYGKSPVGNAYDYYGEISKEDAAFLQQVAQDTVTKFFGR